MITFLTNTLGRFRDDRLQWLELGLSPLDQHSFFGIDAEPDRADGGSTSPAALPQEPEVQLAAGGSRIMASPSGDVRAATACEELLTPPAEAAMPAGTEEPELLWAEDDLPGAIVRSLLALVAIVGLCFIFVAR